MTAIVAGVDFVSVPTQDLERASAFYGETLGLRRSVYRPENNFAEFETGTVTLSVVNPERMGIGEFKASADHLALQVDDVAASRAELEARGVEFMGDIFDSGVLRHGVLPRPRRQRADAPPQLRAAMTFIDTASERDASGGRVLAATVRCFFSKTLDAVGAQPDSALEELDPGLRDALVVGRPISS